MGALLSLPVFAFLLNCPILASSSGTVLRPAAQASPSTSVTDEVGRHVNIPAQVNRVVTLSPDLTETIYALGLEDKLVGDTNFCDTPPAAKLKPHIGTAQNPSIEAIVALRPDLVLASTSIDRRETVDQLARLGLAVYATDPHTVRGVLDSIANVASAVGAATDGQTLVAQLQSRLQRVRNRLAGLPTARVLFVVWKDPLITIGQNTFIADALRQAGAESVIAVEQNWPQISFEEVVRLRPDYIVFTSNHSGDSNKLLSELRSRPDWKGLHAVEMGHVVNISDEIARPSSGLVNAIEELARDVHPEAFPASGAHTVPPTQTQPDISRSPACREESAACAH
jgi:iron complex transport system substrate-binding protein